MRVREAFTSIWRQLRSAVAWGLINVQGADSYRRIARHFGSPFEVCEADKRDLDKVWAWLYHRPFQEVQTARGLMTVHFAAKKGAKILGYVQLAHMSEEFGAHAGYWLYRLEVKFPYRRLGVGERLCGAVIERARAYGAKGLSLLVREDNEPALDLYQKLGFVEIGRIPRSVREGSEYFDEHLMLMRL